jgi:hypothetical protein
MQSIITRWICISREKGAINNNCIKLANKRRQILRANNVYWHFKMVGLVDWLIDCDIVRLCLRTAATNGPVHPPADMWAWRAMVVMLAWYNSWLVHQSSLTFHTSRDVWSKKGGMDEGVRILSISIWNTPRDLSRAIKILRRGICGFMSNPMVCWGFVRP